MITRIEADGFKNLSNADLRLVPLTVITGRNSTGKSSLLQSILLSQVYTKVSPYFDNYFSIHFSNYRNKYTNARQITVKIHTEEGSASVQWEEEKGKFERLEVIPELEKQLFYLSANRIGPENVAKIYPDWLVSGPTGAALFGTFEREKAVPVADELIRDRNSTTLASQINWWLSYILDQKLEISSEKRPTNDVEVHFKSDGIPDILPMQLGAGVSYLAKILILCLRTKKGDVVMIENPEIHLYPLAQSRLAEFLVFIAASGRQLIIETHSNEILTKFRHQVFKGKIPPEDVTIFYKGDVTEPFITIGLDRNGRFDTDFPETFFDATLDELLDMD